MGDAKRRVFRSAYQSTIAVILAMLVAACGQSEQPELPRRFVTTYVVQSPSHADAEGLPGEVRPRREIQISFRVGGKLVARQVSLGDAVRSGQVLARLDPTDARLSAEAAQAALDVANVDLEFNRHELERYRELKEAKFVSAAALQAKEAAYQAALARSESERSRTLAAHRQSEYADLTATFNAIVIAVLAEPGQVVSAGQTVLQLAPSNEKDILIAVPENRLNEVRAARTVSIKLWGDGSKTYTGHLYEVAPMADPVAHTFAARVAIDNATPEVRFGMTAHIYMKSEPALPLVRIPVAALAHNGSDTVVWLVGPDGRVQPQLVSIGEMRDDSIAIRQGLRGGERIVAAGAHKLLAGELVRIE